MSIEPTPPDRLRFLHLEDNESDAYLISSELKRTWPDCELVRAHSRASFVDALNGGRFDVILSDFALPGFDGFAALAIAREMRPETAFILVSGTIGEEMAVTALQAGAIDYVLKDRPARLVPSIQRAMREKTEQRSRQIAEQKVHETEERFRQLAEASSDVFWFADLDPLTIRYVSPAIENIWGRKPEEFYADARLWLTGVYPEDRARVEQNFNAWLAGERLSFVEEFRVVRTDGAIRWVYDTGTFNVDPTGRIKRISGVTRDITLTKEATEHSLRAQRLESIGLLAGGIAHDLNNALAPVLMGLELFRPKVGKGDERVFKQMEASASRGAAMVRQLLGFARGAEGRKAIVDPRRAVREVEQLMSGTFPKAVTTRIEYPAQIARIEVDPTLLHQVLLNLCVNARDAMPNGGTLILGVENKHIDESYAGFIRDAKPGAYVVFSVTDSGTGIPSELLPKIFDPFFTTKPAGVGTGLGLTTVAGITHNHGGFVRVSSEVGKGTTFKVYLPAIAAGSNPPFAASPATHDYQGHGEGILIVDDEEAVRMLLKSLLERFGFEVFLANEGTEALAQFAQHQDAIKLVIVDERMPHMDGLTLVRILRHMRSELAVIAMSGLYNETQVKEFVALGVGQVLHKPFTMEQLTEALRVCLEVRPAQRELKLGK